MYILFVENWYYRNLTHVSNLHFHKFKWALSLFFHFFRDLLTSNNISFGVISSDLPFIFNRLIVCKTVEYIDQSDNNILTCTML